jgi:hypothetical protein
LMMNETNLYVIVIGYDSAQRNLRICEIVNQLFQDTNRFIHHSVNEDNMRVFTNTLVRGLFDIHDLATQQHSEILLSSVPLLQYQPTITHHAAAAANATIPTQPVSAPISINATHGHRQSVTHTDVGPRVQPNAIAPLQNTNVLPNRSIQRQSQGFVAAKPFNYRS